MFVVACLKVDVRGGSKRAVLGMSNAHGPWRGVSNGGGAMMRNYWDGMTNHLLIMLHGLHLRMRLCMHITCLIQK